MLIISILHDYSFVITIQATLCLLLISHLEFSNQLFFSSQSIEILFKNFEFGIKRIFEGLHRIDLFKYGRINKKFYFFLFFLSPHFSLFFYYFFVVFFFLLLFIFFLGEYSEFISEKLRLKIPEEKVKVNFNIFSSWCILFFFLDLSLFEA